MPHRVKCNGDIFFVDGSHVKSVISGIHKHCYNKWIDYDAIKAEIEKERIPMDMFPGMPNLDGLGYIDFDEMERQKSKKPVIAGVYEYCM